MSTSESRGSGSRGSKDSGLGDSGAKISSSLDLWFMGPSAGDPGPEGPSPGGPGPGDLGQILGPLDPRTQESRPRGSSSVTRLVSGEMSV